MQSQNPQSTEASTTKPSSRYRVYSFSKNVVAVCAIFWLLYTITYQFLDGWHWNAVSPSEKVLDTITWTVWNFFAFIMFIIWVFKMDDIMEKDK